MSLPSYSKMSCTDCASGDKMSEHTTWVNSFMNTVILTGIHCRYSFGVAE